MSATIMEEDTRKILDLPLPWERFFGKSVLITGAGGFLAAYLVQTLLALNDSNLGKPCRVLGLVRNLSRAERLLGTFANRNDFSLICGDVTEPFLIEEKLHFIIHAASQASPKHYLVDPVGTLNANVAGTQRLLELARMHLCEGFLFFSSGEVYGQPIHLPTAETEYGYLDPTNVRACYAEAKRIGETMCVAWSHQYGIPTYIVRPFHTYGPGVSLDDGRVFADFIADIRAQRDLTLKSDGLAQRAFCYAGDATGGFFTVLLKGQDRTPYNIGNENAFVSIRRLAEILVQKAFPELALKLVIAPSMQNENYARSPILDNCPDTSRARLLGWTPAIGLVEGFRRTIASFG